MQFAFAQLTVNASALASILLLGFAAGPNVGRAQGNPALKVSTNSPVPIKKPADLKFKQESFTFVRIQYSSGRGRSLWSVDYPDADLNFSTRFQKVTGLKTELEGKVMALTNAELKRHPFIYIAEGASMSLSVAEMKSLREYLLGGGFLMVDDFWGEAEWESFNAEMKRVFPEREAVELPIEHPLFHCFYDISEKPQVPNFRLGMESRFTGITWERQDAKVPHYRGLFDDNGRLMAIFCHNIDLGDGWEREDVDEYYFREFSLKKAYPMGINIVISALSQ
jgi:hypothetical protein